VNPVNDIFVARQPIFDARRNVVAYELLYRSNGDVDAAGDFDASTMSSAVLVNGVVGMGLASLTDGQRAFINLSEEMLLEGAAELLDSSSVVIEVLETVRPTPEVIAACRKLADLGYSLALDDFVYDDAYLPLLEVADIVKVDVLESGDDLDSTAARLHDFDVTLLAEKVENAEVHARCVDLGFELFQGFHYFRPETVSKKDIASQSVSIIRLMNLLQDANATDARIEEAFKSDPSLTYKLLRIVNSASVGGRGVQSIAHGLRLLGRDPLYRWLCLLLMAAGSGGGEMRIELIKDALLRARMAEAVGDLIRRSRDRANVPSAGSMFLIGLFSRIDHLLGVSVEDILADLDVAPAVREALVERTGVAGTILGAVEAYSEADWDGAEREVARMGGDKLALPELYLDAVSWAGASMATHRAA
jgi:c-di-GMP phosphodiesterase